MKLLKFIIPCLTLILILALTPACASAEPEVPEEPVAEESVPEEEPPDEEITVEELVEEATEGEPELLWSVEHEDQDFGLNCVATSPDGETLVVGSYLTTYTHLLYDGRIIDANTSHRHSVDDIDFSPDGSVMGVGLGVYGTTLIDTADGSELHQLHGGYDNRIAFSPDGEHVATGNRDGIVWIWQLEDGEQAVVLENPEIAEKTVTNRWIHDIDYHPSGKILSSVHNDKTVYIWDIEKEQVIHKLDVSTVYRYNTFQFSPDGEVMAGAVREDGKYLVRLWAVDNYEQLAELVVPGEVKDIAFSPDGSLLAVASHAGALSQALGFLPATTIWDIQSKTLLYTLNQEFSTDWEDKDWLVAVAFTPDGGHLAVVRNNGILEMWRLPGADPFEEPEIDMKEPPPLPSDVLFDTGSSELKAGADEVLEEFALDLHAALPEAKMTFIGHTDSRGDASSNLQLSIDRATAVRDWFEAWAQENGVDGWELLVDGKGDTELKVPDVDAEGNFREEAGKLNRRVEIEIEVTN